METTQKSPKGCQELTRQNRLRATLQGEGTEGEAQSCKAWHKRVLAGTKLAEKSEEHE